VVADDPPGQNSGTVVVGTELAYPPYSFLDENGEPAGYNVDLTQAIAAVMRLDIEVRIGPWGEIRRALEAGEIDATLPDDSPKDDTR
jgi:polar amino acid transport system substrate-binding protein